MSKSEWVFEGGSDWEWEIDWLIDWVSEWVSEWASKQASECVWVSEWVSEWVGEWVRERVLLPSTPNSSGSCFRFVRGAAAENLF